jgi:Bacterial Ig domain
VKGSVWVTAQATDYYGIKSVAFYVDNVLNSTDTTPPYQILLDTTKLTAGTHTLKAIATNTSGMTSTATISVVK